MLSFAELPAEEVIEIIVRLKSITHNRLARFPIQSFVEKKELTEPHPQRRGALEVLIAHLNSPTFGCRPILREDLVIPGVKQNEMIPT